RQLDETSKHETRALKEAGSLKGLWRNRKAFLMVLGFTAAGSLFYFTMVIYGLSLVGFGLLISALCATQQQAFIGVFVFMMPA
ncbi:alpha-ketoglutarate transporter, partial [Salmonella enterica subsp. enterica serovar Cerro]|nr:alpha-ketoglutarate transporter [Salmonella enterica subsp. enterica serovar Cerro]